MSLSINGVYGSSNNPAPTIVRPYDFGTDAIERQRVSLGQALIDADFEYGLQATKWQSFFDMRKIPSFYEIPGSDMPIANIVADTTVTQSSTTSLLYSNVVIFYSSYPSINIQAGNVLSVFSLYSNTLTADRAEGYYICTSNVSPNQGNPLGSNFPNLYGTANYIAKGLITNTNGSNYSNIQTNLSTVRRGGIFNNYQIKVPVLTVTPDTTPPTAGLANVTVVTSNAHGISFGSPITANNITSYAAPNFSGTFLVSQVLDSNTFNVSVATNQSLSGYSGISSSNLFITPYASTVHRPYDGGVLLSSLSPTYGSTVIRQSKKCFRYQSGKGILFSSGTLFCPNIDIASMNVSGVTTTTASTTTYPNTTFTASVNVPVPGTVIPSGTTFTIPAYSGLGTLTLAGNLVYGVQNINITISSGSVSQNFPNGGIPAGTAVNIGGQNVTFAATAYNNYNLALTSATGFAAGQVIASVLGLSLGTSTILSISGTTATVQYTGTWPVANSGIPGGTAVTVLPVGSNLTIVTDTLHGLPQGGAFSNVRNITTGNIAGSYTISSVINSRTVNVATYGTLGQIPITLGDQPRLIVTRWHGASVRAGVFEDANGMFWEYDGQTLSVVRRQSTYQMAGLITVQPNQQVVVGTQSGTFGTIPSASNFTTQPGDSSNVITTSGAHSVLNNMYFQYVSGTTNIILWVIGIPDYNQITVGFLPTVTGFTIPSAALQATNAWILPTTRFQDQLRVNDRFTIRGMTHQVTSIQGQGILTMNPPYRGTVSIATGVKMCKIKELRIPQTQFNRDRMDGTGPSGYIVDLNKQQMIGLQYTWYGAGFIDFMIRGPDGNYIIAHRIRNNNVNDEAYMRSGNQPVRYELSVESRGAISALANNIFINSSSLQIVDNLQFFPSSNAVLQIDNELIGYTSFSGNTFTGLTRSAPLTYVMNDTARTFSCGPASCHSAGTTVSLVSCTATPTLTHWGSSFLIDGGFDFDRGYYFNYSNTAVNLTSTNYNFTVTVASTSAGNFYVGDTVTISGTTAPYGSPFTIVAVSGAANNPAALTVYGSTIYTTAQPQQTFTYSGQTVSNQSRTGTAALSASGTVTVAALNPSAIAFLIRLSPSVSGGLCGDIGVKELLNRAQFLLQKLEVTSPTNVQTAGILNPVGLVVNTANWQQVNSFGTGSQPSFAQIYVGAAGIPQPGERIFQTIVQANNQNNLDLSSLKEMNNAILGGNQNFPDGPDTLCIYLTNISPSSGATVQCNLFWSEAQA